MASRKMSENSGGRGRKGKAKGRAPKGAAAKRKAKEKPEEKAEPEEVTVDATGVDVTVTLPKPTHEQQRDLDDLLIDPAAAMVDSLERIREKSERDGPPKWAGRMPPGPPLLGRVRTQTPAPKGLRAVREIETPEEWPEGDELPTHYQRPRPVPCRNPDCRRIRLESGSQACVVTGYDGPRHLQAYFRCRVCRRTFSMPVKR